MRKQVFSFLLLTAVCAALLFYSASKWKENIRTAGIGKTDTSIEEVELPEVVETLSADKIRELGASLDERTLDVILSRAADGENVQMLAVGSEAFGPVAERFADEVEAAYEGLIDIEVATFDMTSAQFIEEMLAGGLIDWKKGYDIILYEPFTLNNNGLVTIEDERVHILDVKSQAENHVSDSSFLITPPQPIYGARFYLSQINGLRDFTENQGIPYINHWENWPDHQSEEIIPYLDDNSNPTELGMDAWAEPLIHYFVSSSRD